MSALGIGRSRARVVVRAGRSLREVGAGGLLRTIRAEEVEEGAAGAKVLMAVEAVGRQAPEARVVRVAKPASRAELVRQARQAQEVRLAPEGRDPVPVSQVATSSSRTNARPASPTRFARAAFGSSTACRLKIPGWT